MACRHRRALGLLLDMPLLTPHTLEREAETVTNTLGAAEVKENFIFVIHDSVIQPQGQMQRDQVCKQMEKKQNCFVLIASMKGPGVRHLQAMCYESPCPYPTLGSAV